MEAESDCKGTGVWQMSNFGHIHGDVSLRQEQSQEALRHVIAREIIHVLITLPVCHGDDFCAGPSIVSSRQPGTRLRDPTLRLTQHESLIVSRQPDTSATTLFLSSSSALIFHCPDNACINLSTGSYKASVCPWLYCLSHWQELHCHYLPCGYFSD